jgi:HK97 gp10 family phage protein
MPDISVEVNKSSVDKVQAMIASKLNDVVKGIGPILMEGGELMSTAIKEECPVAKVNGGTLRSSVSAEQISDKEVHVAPHTFYAPYVEFGHGNWSGDPFMKRGVEKSRNNVMAYIKSKLAEK